ncbi:nuclear factor Y, subunit C10 [Wolffia australiana]
MPQSMAGDIVVVSSSSSSDVGEDEGRSTKTSGAGYGRPSAKVERKRTRNAKMEEISERVIKEGDLGQTKKRKRDDEEDRKMSSSTMSCTGDFATSDSIVSPSAALSFPMSRVRRLIASSDGASANGGNLRTNLDSVFVINQAAKMFLEGITREAYSQAMREQKKAVCYKHLSSTVGREKRYEFLSDFVPEKLSAEAALNALAEE